MTETITEGLVDYLASKGIQTWPAAGSEVTAHCFLDCVSDKGKGKLYFNTETWLWDCKRCQRHGGRYLLLEHFGDRDEHHDTGNDPATKMAVLGAYAEYAADLLRRNDDKLLYLLGRGLHPETIMDARLGFVPRNFSVAGSLDGFTRADFENAGMTHHGRDFHAGRLLIPYLQRGRVLQIRGKEIGGRYYTPAGDQVRLYNADSLRGAETVIIAEGELDTLILQQTLRMAPHSPNESAAVVGIPGAGAWPGGKDHFGEYFREARRVYIALDPDETGVRAARQMKEALGSKARIVVLPNDSNVRDDSGEPVKCDWTEYLRQKDDAHPWGGHSATDVDDLVHEAEMSGRRIFSMAEAHSKWRKDRNERPGLQLGFKSLDSLMPRGLRPGNVMVTLAKTGTGKTQFLANCDYNMRQRRVLHITLENTVSELFEVLWRIYHFWNPAADDFHIERDFPYLRVVDQNQLTPAEFGTIVEEYIADVGEPPEHCVIDYLGYMARSQRGNSQYEKVTNAMMDTKAIAKAYELSIHIPHQVARTQREGQPFQGDEARDSGAVEETADFQLGLYRPHEALDTKALGTGSVDWRFNAQMMKSRQGNKGRIVQLAASPASLVIADQLDHIALQRIQQEVEAYNRGMSYEDIAAGSRRAAWETRQLVTA